MKKYIAVVMTLIIIAACFTACGNKIKVPEVDGAQVVTDEFGEFYPVSTEADGSVTRNEKGEIELIVTNANGKAVKDDDGNYVTEIADLENGLVLGNRVEYTRYSILVPDDWTCLGIYANCVLKLVSPDEYDETKDDEYDTIIIYESKDDINSFKEKAEKVQNSYIENYPDAVTVKTFYDLHGYGCPFYSTYVPDNGNGGSNYLGTMYYSDDNGRVYSFSLISTNDMTDKVSKILDVFDSIQFYDN